MTKAERSASRREDEQPRQRSHLKPTPSSTASRSPSSAPEVQHNACAATGDALAPTFFTSASPGADAVPAGGSFLVEVFSARRPLRGGGKTQKNRAIVTPPGPPRIHPRAAFRSGRFLERRASRNLGYAFEILNQNGISSRRRTAPLCTEPARVRRELNRARRRQLQHEAFSPPETPAWGARIGEPPRTRAGPRRPIPDAAMAAGEQASSLYATASIPRWSHRNTSPAHRFASRIVECPTASPLSAACR